MYKTMDANYAVSLVSYKFSEVCGIYPITPASPMADNVDRLSNLGEVNFFGNRVKSVFMQSEAGAVSVVHGSLQSGVLASTFTASQGLLLMIPSLYKLAGEMLPGVIHVASRSLSTHALSIFGDHQDVYACRSTGCCMLCSSSVSEAYYMAAVAHLAAIKCSLPFINFFDGFRTSHEINKVKLMDMDLIGKLIDQDALAEFRSRGMNDSKPDTRGVNENDDVYFQHTEARNLDYVNAFANVVKTMDDVNEVVGCCIKPFNYYGSKNASVVIVAMGSVCCTIRETLDYLNSNGYECGLVEVHLFRPFNGKYLLDLLPDSVDRVAVLDRSKDAGSEGEALYLDVVNALKDTSISVCGGRYGLSSKNTVPRDIKAVYDMLWTGKLKYGFTIGIDDDVTNLSLKVDDLFRLPSDMLELLIYGYGSDGMVSTSKDLLKIIGDNTDKYVQGYFQYDSKKSGGVTRCHIRVSDSVIERPYYVDSPSFVVVSKDSYIYKYDILSNISKGGILLLNTNLSDNDLVRSLPDNFKYLLASREIKFYAIDAYRLVNEMGLGNKISTCMEVCIFHIINIINDDVVNDIMKESNKKRFFDKGIDIVDINNKVVDVALNYLRKVDVDEDWSNLEFESMKEISFEDALNGLQGDKLPVSAFLKNRSGIFVGGTSCSSKRGVASVVPKWIPDACIQCNKCSFVCPNAVIRPFLVKDGDSNVKSIPAIMPKGVNYSVGVSAMDCTGCGLCYNVCNGKMGKKAIEMVNYDRNDNDSQREFDYLLVNNVNDSYNFKVMNVRNEGFVKPKFEFNASCAGCGEAPYLKNLTQVFNNNLFIANATGCSSIYGGSIPNTPYSVAWASSLFEDNSEYGLGILCGIQVKREQIARYMENNLNKDRELFERWLDNRDDYDTCLEVYKKIDFNRHLELDSLKDFITPKSVWIVGGDGFAYDIGYGGLDHVLAKGEDVNVLILDTEVYSNTGGQASKASNIGAVAAFESAGKGVYKKDLARIFMCYPNVYVACVNVGYDMEHYLRVLREADRHKGPSIIIAYAPCVEHGIKKGMSYSMVEGGLASECGYFLTFSYNPDNSKFTLNSRNVDFSLYDKFLMGENRYSKLKAIDEDRALNLLESQKKWAVVRYEYYKNLDKEL